MSIDNSSTYQGYNEVETPTWVSAILEIFQFRLYVQFFTIRINAMCQMYCCYQQARCKLGQHFIEYKTPFLILLAQL